METLAQLIEKTDADEQIAKKAVAKLVAIGMPAVPSIIDTIRLRSATPIWKSRTPTWRLRQVLHQIHHPDLIPVLIGLLQDESSDLAITAFEVLGQSRDQRALQPLLNALSSDLTDFLAIPALGELGNPQGIKPLLKVAGEILQEPNVALVIEGKPVHEDFYEVPLTLLPKIIIALAKLGNYEIAPLTIPLTHYHAHTHSSEEKDIRITATEALQYVVIPGMFPALQAALHNEDQEVRLEAVAAMFYLGIKEAIPELIACVQDENSMVRNNVLVRLHDLTGTWFKDDAKVGDLQEWWEQHQAEYERGVCYRLGKPLHLPDVIVLLDDINNRKTIMQELKVITGVNFGSHPDVVSQSPGILVQLAQEWWKEEGHKFEDGCLYKYGYKHNINNIF
jgi:hypothetical protein